MTPARKRRPPADPYRNYTFRVKLDGRVVAGVSHVSALQRTTDVVEYRQGGAPDTTHRMPGRTKFDPITLERGISYDSTFETWANQVTGTVAAQLRSRKELRIEVFDVDGHLELAYNVHHCWPSEYVALSGLEAGAPVCLIQSVTLQNEGWERDTSVKVPGKRKRLRHRQ